MQSPARVSDSTTLHALREVATIAKCTEHFVSTTSLGWDNRRLLPIVQGHIDKISGEHSSVFETRASDVAPLKSLIPFSFEVHENTNRTSASSNSAARTSPDASWRVNSTKPEQSSARCQSTPRGETPFRHSGQDDQAATPENRDSTTSRIAFPCRRIMRSPQGVGPP
jgi:hypothetical protein